MPIPDFDHNNVLPPHLGSPALTTDLSPYTCTTVELCHKFSTSTERVEILKGLLSFRQQMVANGIVNGFQWIDGSFLENVEASENRAPRDIDVVTFFGGLSPTDIGNLGTSFPEFANPPLAKTNFKVDHYPVDYTYDPDVTVEATRYWIQLFTHNRQSVWKGILRIGNNTPTDDGNAIAYLNSL